MTVCPVESLVGIPQPGGNLKLKPLKIIRSLVSADSACGVSGVGVGVLVGVVVGVLVGVFVAVSVGVIVGVGVSVGPNNCPGPQPEINKLAAKKQTAMVCRFVFIDLLRYHGRTRRRLEPPKSLLDNYSPSMRGSGSLGAIATLNLDAFTLNKKSSVRNQTLPPIG